nr:MAG TPA: hypothetical protein [Caudoviricetes sp.]
MTRAYAYTFKLANGKEVTLKKSVTDQMEERNFHKAAYAAEYFNRILRSKYGYKKSIVTARNLVEIQ